MSTAAVVTTIDAKEVGLKKIASGKVREIFEIDGQTLLFVATDRISAYDVILSNGIPAKGAILTQLSVFWFEMIKTRLPNLRTHLISDSVPPSLSSDVVQIISRRSMQVRRYSIIPLESIVRGYITGTAWSEYTKSGTVHGMQAPAGLRESQKLDQPIWTPSTKAEADQHDENISEERAVEIVGKELAEKVKKASIEIYQMAHTFAAECGIIIADTKFEFGYDKQTNEIVLVDEVLTPDSSRFWPADKYEIGKSQQSYDKQYLRDWLTGAGLKGKNGTHIPEEVVAETAAKYKEAYAKLTGQEWS